GDLLYHATEWIRAYQAGGSEDAACLGQAARPRRAGVVGRGHVRPARLYWQMAPRLAKVHRRIREKEEERSRGTTLGLVRLASAQVGRQRALRKPLINPGKGVRKACLKPGRLIELQEVHVTRQAYGPILVLCCWAKGYHEPLYLVSNLATAEE